WDTLLDGGGAPVGAAAADPADAAELAGSRGSAPETLQIARADGRRPVRQLALAAPPLARPASAPQRPAALNDPNAVPPAGAALVQGGAQARGAVGEIGALDADGAGEPRRVPPDRWLPPARPARPAQRAMLPGACRPRRLGSGPRLVTALPLALALL